MLLIGVLLLCNAFLLSTLQPHIHQQKDECTQDTQQQEPILLWVNPELFEEVDATEYLYWRPKDDYCRHSHSNVCTPSGDMELSTEHKE